LRISLAAGLFFVLLGSSAVLARADELVQPTKQVPAPVTQSVGPQSPDLATWTSSGAALPALVETQPAYEHTLVRSHTLSRFAGHVLRRVSTIARALTRDALRFLGTPYVFGGTSGYGFDCSGYVQHVFAMVGVHIPRMADEQYYAGSRIQGRPLAGDLVFFQTYESGPSHVGIYLGSGRFVHASSSHGVMVSSLGDSYWSARYLGAKRLTRRH